MSKQKRRLWQISLLLVVVIGICVVWWQQTKISDWFRLLGYHAPANISLLADNDGMTSLATHDFYINHPRLSSSRTDFTTHCPVGSEQTIVLGCYHSNQAGIFLLQETDPLLAGVVQVTAAHEMLHAAYDRLSTADRNYVDGLLLDYYNHDLTDPRVESEINAYKKTEPHDVVNEMHSVFGTEIATLPEPLEAYYRRYFTNREQIIAYANQYQGEFTSRQNQVAQDDTELTQLHQQIVTAETDAQGMLNSINAQRSQMDTLRSGGNYTAYNALVDSFNTQVTAYNQQVNDIKNLITNYNDLVSSRNALALETQQLTQELSGQLQYTASQ